MQVQQHVKHFMLSLFKNQWFVVLLKYCIVVRRNHGSNFIKKKKKKQQLPRGYWNRSSPSTGTACELQHSNVLTCLYGFQARAGFHSDSSVCMQIKRTTVCARLCRQSLSCFLWLILLRLVLMFPNENTLKPLKVFMHALLRPQKLSAGGQQGFHLFSCCKGSAK